MMTSGQSRRVLIVGNGAQTHVGRHFGVACAALGVAYRLCDTTRAFGGPIWKQKIDWWLRGRRPARLQAFSREMLAAARKFQPDTLISTGLAPIDAPSLAALGDEGVLRVNFLTDDPWSVSHRGDWFLRALEHYDVVFSPRRLTLTDIGSLGPVARFLPFGYAPDTHFIDASGNDRSEYDADVMFAGGADRDRVAMLAPLVRSGLRVALYGGYWRRYAETRTCARGYLDAAGLRRATRGARVVVCLVRRANRDSHCMRTYEAPAMGGCLVVERTEDHVALFGPDGEAVLFFDSTEEIVEKTRWLLDRPDERRRLAARAHEIVTTGAHRYQDRVSTLLRESFASWNGPEMPRAAVAHG